MNYELKLASQWIKLNKLSLNKDKTKLILFHSSYKDMNSNLLSIKLDEFKLTPVDHVKYLGMYLDSHLSFLSIYPFIFLLINCRGERTCAPEQRNI